MGLRAVSNAGDYLGAFAWASLPAAASYAGYRARVTDYGVNLMVISDGTGWRPLGKQTLGRSFSNALTGTTAETVLATVTIPGNLLGTLGAAWFYFSQFMTNNANNKILRVRLGGIGGTVIVQTASASIAANGDFRHFRNAGAANSQVHSMSSQTATPFGNSSATPVTSAVDMTQNQDLVVTGQLAVGTDSLTLNELTVEVSA